MLSPAKMPLSDASKDGNPVVSIGPVLAVPGVRDALRGTRAPVVGLSPIVGGAPVRGMADACLAAIGVETSAEAVARHYGARADGGLIDAWLVDESEQCTDFLVRHVQRAAVADEAQAGDMRIAIVPVVGVRACRWRQESGLFVVAHRFDAALREAGQFTNFHDLSRRGLTL